MAHKRMSHGHARVIIGGGFASGLAQNRALTAEPDTLRAVLSDALADQGSINCDECRLALDPVSRCLASGDLFSVFLADLPGRLRGFSERR